MKLDQAGKRRLTRAGILMLVAACTVLAGSPAAAQSNRGSRENRRERGKFDLRLRERLDASRNEETTERVIITVRRDARGRFGDKVRSRGGRVGADLALVGGTAATLSRRQLRALAQDSDVVSISADADVKADGVASAATGSPAKGGYSLRSAIGLRAVGSTTSSATFQRGVNGYAGSTDTGVDATQLASNATATSVYIDGSSFAPARMLLRFNDLFGAGPGQIPPGSTIVSASLRVNQSSSGSSSASMRLHRMLAPWEDSSTWLTLLTSGPGLQFDNAEAASSADASVSNLNHTGHRTFSGAGMTATVQAWANGQPNHGWVLTQTSSSEVRLSTADTGTTSNRPLLTVTYKAPVEATNLTGNGVTVAIIDSGLLEDGGGTSRIKTTRDFTQGSANPPHVAPLDPYGHGTHVAGLVGSDKTEVEGVAPGVKFVSLRVLDANGAGSTSWVINAIQWAVANKAAYGIDVINLSLGHPIFEPAATDPLVQAVEAAVRAGITVVASAGNVGQNPLTGLVGYAGVTSPGNAPSAITVGSTRTKGTTRLTDDLVSDFSSRGPTWYDGFAKPDIIAPGQNLLSAAASSQKLYSTRASSRGPSYGGRAYLHLSGTSMAAGVVSGTVALMIEQAKQSFGVRPTTNALKAALQRTAVPLADDEGVRYSRLAQGAGSLNAIGAVSLAAVVDPRVGVNGHWATGAAPSTVTIDGQVISLNENIVWGDHVLWGDALDRHLKAWDDNIVWGDDDNIVWGDSLASQSFEDNIVWGDNASWGDNIVWGDSFNIIVGLNDNIVWGDTDNIVWGDTDNIVWGDNDNIVWGDSDGGVWDEAVELFVGDGTSGENLESVVQGTDGSASGESTSVTSVLGW